MKMRPFLFSSSVAILHLVFLFFSLAMPAQSTPFLSNGNAPSAYLSRAISTDPIESRTKILDRRVANHLAITDASRHSQIVPIQAASTSLWLLYSSIQRQALGPWASIPIQADLWMTLGNLRICFASLHGIPWDFVAWFAGKMITATLRGFTGTWDQMYQDPHNPAHGGVIIWLRVINPITGQDVD